MKTYPCPYEDAASPLTEDESKTVAWCQDHGISLKASIITVDIAQVETWEHKQNRKHIAKLTGILAKGKALPPPFVHGCVEEDAEVRLMDGHHRLYAHAETESEIDCVEVPKNTYEALVFENECPFFGGDDGDLCLLIAKMNPHLWG